MSGLSRMPRGETFRQTDSLRWKHLSVTYLVQTVRRSVKPARFPSSCRGQIYLFRSSPTNSTGSRL